MGLWGICFLCVHVRERMHVDDPSSTYRTLWKQEGLKMLFLLWYAHTLYEGEGVEQRSSSRIEIELYIYLRAGWPIVDMHIGMAHRKRRQIPAVGKREFVSVCACALCEVLQMKGLEGPGYMYIYTSHCTFQGWMALFRWNRNGRGYREGRWG